ncbi:MAG: helix-turn-helix transcriptional regulator [Lachnospiraceae bacterium]|nr:helix-turn-helix transcriptional regulator [Lachnospiraceae bacterium]
MYEKFFAERLTALRQQKNVSAREMSLSIGQNDSYINRIENGKAFPSMQVFFYICEYLDITPQEFWDCENDAPKKISKISDTLKKFNSEQLDAFLNLINKVN